MITKKREKLMGLVADLYVGEATLADLGDAVDQLIEAAKAEERERCLEIVKTAGSVVEIFDLIRELKP